MELEIQTLMAIQDESAASIANLYENFKKEPKDRRTNVFLKVKQQRIQEMFSKFSGIHDTISKNIPPSERKINAYLKCNMYGQIEDIYYKMITKIETWREELEVVQQQQIQIPENTIFNVTQAQTARRSDVRLPRVNIQSFSGDYRKWTSFKNVYTSLIHTKDDITSVEKFYFLKQHVTGEASRLIDHYTISDGNYDAAWDALEKRYNNLRILVHSETRALRNQPSMTAETAVQVRKLLDTTLECLNSLHTLKVDTTTWDPILMCILQEKLNAETQYHWENYLDDPKQIPTVKQFTDFLEARFNALENLSVVKAQSFSSSNYNRFSSGQSTKYSNDKQQKQVKYNNDKQRPQFQRNTNSTSGSSGANTTPHRTFHATASLGCFICEGDHGFIKCPEFMSANVEQRVAIVRKNNRCQNCLKNHSEEECGSPKRCKKCKLRHHTLLHFNPRAECSNTTRTEPHEAKKQTTSSYFTHKNNSDNNYTNSQILLATVLVNIASNGTNYTLRCLLDQGSQSSFITEDAVQRLKLHRTPVFAQISGLASSTSETSKSMVNFNIKSIYQSSFQLPVEALVLSKITNSLPSTLVTMGEWSHISDLQLADPNFKQPNRIDILLGADVYGGIILDGLRKGASHEPIAQNTHLGWMISGFTANKIKNISVTTMLNRIDIDQQLRKFWEQEEISSEKAWTADEIKCEEHFKSTYSRCDDGRYEVALPFRDMQNRNPLGKSKYRALVRLTSLEKKFASKPEFKIQYAKVLSEYIELQHMVPAENVDEYKEVYFTPHHGVVKESSTTTKLRVVFDASAKTKSNQSLNDQLLVGPTIQQELATILMRWRRYKIALSADIAKMYRQIKLRKEDWDFQRILWRNDIHQKVQEYNLTTVTFGNAAAPFLAVRSLHQLANDEKGNFFNVAEIVKKDFYVDDLLTGANNVQEAITIQKDITALLSKGGFELRSWISNSQTVLKNVPEAAREVTLPFSINSELTTKTLGIFYYPQSDSFKFKINLPDTAVAPTKRTLLAETARLFDPLGWLSPVIVKAKIFFQQLWKRKMSWDDKLDKELAETWLKFRNELKILEKLEIPRWVHICSNTVSVQLHGFSDASELAYGAVVYIRVQTTDGSVKVSMLTSKTRVAPIKLMSIPRLELCAAALLAQLLEKTRKALEINNIELYGWSDSKIVLAWLKGDSSKWKTFVSHRVTEIQAYEHLNGWKYIHTSINPADCASRGIYPAQLESFRLWWEGPDFLRSSEFRWNEDESEYDTLVEQKTHHITALVQTKCHQIELINRYSSIAKLIRTIATCMRFAYNCKNKVKRSGTLFVAELNAAETTCIKIIQLIEFSAEMTALNNQTPIKSSSKLLTFHPFIDKQGILRVGGRIDKAQVRYAQKHPIILPASTHLTTLYINDAHVRTEHGGVAATVTLLRQRFWILKTRNTVKRQIDRCFNCFKFKTTMSQQIMGSLPFERLAEVRPFTNVGVDYAGPINIKASLLRSNKIVKGYICLFVCFSTKATHIEAVTALTTDAFLAAFNRFVARRGLPSKVYSDNGSNFIGADRELKGVFQKILKEGTLANNLANRKIQWHFIPPRAPHFGGLWEAGIKSVKARLKRTIGNTVLNYEEFSTVLTQIEACLNSRPLQPFTEDINDFAALTPGHFLIGSELIAPPAENLLEVNSNRIRKWKHLQQLYQHFWNRWSKEYISTLQQRYKWKQYSKAVKRGDMVLVKEDNVPPTNWNLARIEEVHPGSDGQIRVVTLRTPNGFMKRALSKLCPLPIEDNENN